MRRWSYKTVHYPMKKEGLLGSAFLDEFEIETSLNEYGIAGWELVSVIENLEGLTAIFKQPLGEIDGVVADAGEVPVAAGGRGEDDIAEVVVVNEKKSEPDRLQVPTTDDADVDSDSSEMKTDRSGGRRTPVKPADLGSIRIT